MQVSRKAARAAMAWLVLLGALIREKAEIEVRDAEPTITGPAWVRPKKLGAKPPPVGEIAFQLGSAEGFFCGEQVTDEKIFASAHFGLQIAVAYV